MYMYQKANVNFWSAILEYKPRVTGANSITKFPYYNPGPIDISNAEGEMDIQVTKY